MPVHVPLLGIRVDPLTTGEILDAVLDGIRDGGHLVVGNHNLHSAYLVRVSDEFQNATGRFDLSLIDGFPVLLLASAACRRWLGARRRIGSMDWVPRLLAEGGVRRVAVVGGSSESNRGAVARIRGLAPTSSVIGLAGADWDGSRAVQVATSLRAFRPELVLVGLGMPRQEVFLQRSALLLPPAVYATVGGAIDQLAGVQLVAPRWLGLIGAEWLWRLATQPRRLWFRYLVEPLLLVRLVLLAHLAARRARTAPVPLESAAEVAPLAEPEEALMVPPSLRSP